ncbi:hypothetical protein PF008_g18611 [Phytophthora fragariae]|uniref:Uncharacterized protein n=1 Tax=Phytophthora fragariae TaxID=53985 RepID=A0A6G0R546_9STRA|nr:hypothetical protein PF008_g18611 [Phytophthora fragariae]
MATRQHRVADRGGGRRVEAAGAALGAAGQLDKLEESQTKLEQRLVLPKKGAKALMDTSLFMSALGLGSRMHIDSLSGTPHTKTPRRSTAPPQYFGLRHADVRSHKPGYGMSELQRHYAVEHAAQAGQGAQQPPEAPVPAPRPPDAQPPAAAPPSICSRTRAGAPIPEHPPEEAGYPTARSCTSGLAPASWAGAEDSSGRWRSGSRRAPSRGRGA